MPLFSLTGDANPPDNIVSWFKCQGAGKTREIDSENPYDIVAVGSQVSVTYSCNAKQR